MPSAGLSIRERTADDIAVFVDIHNRSVAPTWYYTVDERRRFEDITRPEPPPLSLLAFIGDEPVAVGEARRMIWDREGRVGIDVMVVPERRRQGIGSTLYARLKAHAVEHGARELIAFVPEDRIELSQGWLEQEGYTEIERMRMSEQSLSAFDPSVFDAAGAKARAAGVEFVTLADVDTEENRRKLWELNTIVERDVPASEHEDAPFEDFERQLNRLDHTRDCMIIARHGDEFVGFTILGHRRPDLAFIEMTGVHPSWRNQGVATTLKVQSAVLAREKGYTAIRTFNHVNNGAMLAVNGRLGYRPLPEALILVKRLSSASSSTAHRHI